MHPFPFSKTDWQRVAEAARQTGIASEMDDEVLTATRKVAMHHLLDDLRATYGEHPVLLETEGDFLDDPLEQVGLYRRAVELAETHALPTFSVRLALAAVHLDALNDATAAKLALLACQPLLDAEADESERRQWRELLSRCQ